MFPCQCKWRGKREEEKERGKKARGGRTSKLLWPKYHRVGRFYKNKKPLKM